jgi:hypothetical protein
MYGICLANVSQITTRENVTGSRLAPVPLIIKYDPTLVSEYGNASMPDDE